VGILPALVRKVEGEGKGKEKGEKGEKRNNHRSGWTLTLSIFFFQRGAILADGGGEGGKERGGEGKKGEVLIQIFFLLSPHKKIFTFNKGKGKKKRRGSSPIQRGFVGPRRGRGRGNRR